MADNRKKAVRIIAYQNLSSYRVPSSLAIKESYPLPPYSSVIGMVHAACGFDKYVPMQVSIQGNCESHVSEVYTRYQFGRNNKCPSSGKCDKQAAGCKGCRSDFGTRWNVKMRSGDAVLGMNRGVGAIELLVDVRLILHIIPEDEAMIPVIAEGLRNPKQFLSLGRHEDLLRIDAVDLCEIKQTELSESKMIPFDAYIPLSEMEHIELASNATVYRLHKDYTIDPLLNIRLWNHVHTRFVKAGAQSEMDEGSMVWLDETPASDNCCVKFDEELPVYPA